MQMHDRQDEDLLFIDCEEDSVRETSRHRASRFAVNDRELKRVIFDSLQQQVHILDELDAESSPFRFVPRGCFINVNFGLNSQNKSATHSLQVEYFSRRRARTSFQGTVSSGLASC